MTVWTCGRWVTLGAMMVLSAQIGISTAEAGSANRGRQEASPARPGRGHASAVRYSTRAIQAGAWSYSKRGRGLAAARYGTVGGGLQCVPFARENTGIELTGNANTWWNAAEGIYERGARPEVGSILSFRANGRMRMGHVAVVSRVIDSRNVEIDHANWSGPGIGRGRIARNIDVVDVSPDNDWTAVRVALGQSEVFGSIYPTSGFIYDRPDRGTMVANAGIAPAPALNPAPSDLRPTRERMLASLGEQDEEVAEAADDTQPRTRPSAPRYSARSKITRYAKPTHAATVRNVSTRAAHPVKAAHRRARHGT